MVGLFSSNACWGLHPSVCERQQNIGLNELLAGPMGFGPAMSLMQSGSKATRPRVGDVFVHFTANTLLLRAILFFISCLCNLILLTSLISVLEYHILIPDAGIDLHFFGGVIIEILNPYAI